MMTSAPQSLFGLTGSYGVLTGQVTSPPLSPAAVQPVAVDEVRNAREDPNTMRTPYL